MSVSKRLLHQIRINMLVAVANEMEASKINPKLVGESGKESESAISHITYA